MDCPQLCIPDTSIMKPKFLSATFWHEMATTNCAGPSTPPTDTHLHTPYAFSFLYKVEFPLPPNVMQYTFQLKNFYYYYYFFFHSVTALA